MMKISIKLFITFIMFSLFICLVKADCECYYKETTVAKDLFGTDNFEAHFKILNTEKKFEVNKFLQSLPVIVDSEIDSKYTDAYLIDYLGSKCSKSIYLCRGEIGMPGGSKAYKYMLILNTSLFSQIPLYSGNMAALGGYSFNIDKNCKIVDINSEKSTCGVTDKEFECDAYDNLYLSMKSSFESSNTDAYNSYKEQIKSYCKSVLNHEDYASSCIKPCLNLASDISKIEKIEVDDTECGLPQKLLAWILNIIKWVKYVIPVIVILLGMIDFIRAVLSDKDDGMKKAQGRFIKRLIAAALIFIVPLILTFIIEKMGFASGTCGIKF